MADNGYLFAGVAGYFGRPDASGAVGVFRRALGANGTWEQVLDGPETHTIVVDPSDPSVVFAGTVDGVWRSTDAGASFRRADFPDSGVQVWSILVDAEDPRRVYAGASPIAVWRSDDGGARWRRLPDPGIAERCQGPFSSRVMRLAQKPGRAAEIFAAVEINGVMRSRDGGESWQDCSDDLVRLSEQPGLASKIVSDTHAEGMLDNHAVAICPAEPDTVIAASRMGLFCSRDDGASWQDLQVGRFSPTTYGRDIKASPHDPATLYAALSEAASSHDGGLYRSQDAGATWQRFDKVQVNGTIMSVGLSPRDRDCVALGARYDGEVWATGDGGESWTAMPLPGDVQDIYAIACT